jgi:ParB family chromosome partitioning protein
MSEQKEEILWVNISDLRESPDNPRKLFGNLKEMSDSIKIHGIIEPIIVRRRPDKVLEINNGHRRFRAAKLAGLKKVPVVIRDLNRQVALEQMIVENKQREDVNDLELADGYRKLMADFGLSADDVADRVGVARSSVYAATRLLDLAEPVQKAILAGKLTGANGLDIAKVRGERMQLDAMHRALKLAKNGDPPSARLVRRMIDSHYFAKAKKGLSKREKEVREVGHDIAIRRRVIARMLSRVVELIERRAHLSDEDLRLGVIALAEVLGEPAREVFQRRGIRVDRLAKVSGAQLRSLMIELPLEAWLKLDENGEYTYAVRATAKAYDLSLSELTAAVEATGAADALFDKS